MAQLHVPVRTHAHQSSRLRHYTQSGPGAYSWLFCECADQLTSLLKIETAIACNICQ